jgi:ComF family protein
MNIWIQSFLDLLFPKDEVPKDLPVLREPFCEVCADSFEGSSIKGEFECQNCVGREWALDCARAGYRADGYVRELIHDFKYRQEFHHLPQLAAWVEEGYRRFYAGQEWTAVVPVPLYGGKRFRRGFNQAYEIACFFAKRVRLPVWPVLERVRDTKTQTWLRRSERCKNVEGAFALKSGFDVGGCRLLVLDDVFTSGATMDACARVLRRAGADYLAALAVARG